MKYDIFISYASEDSEIAEKLSERLECYYYRVWFDKTMLKIGDSLREKIDEGLSLSEYGVVILSHNFFSKMWPIMELDGMMARQSNRNRRILPVYHNISSKEITEFSPILASIIASNTNQGIDSVAVEIREVVPGVRPVLGVKGGCPKCRKGQLRLESENDGICVQSWNDYECDNCGWFCRDYEIYGELWFLYVRRNRELHRMGLL